MKSGKKAVVNQPIPRERNRWHNKAVNGIYLLAGMVFAFLLNHYLGSISGKTTRPPVQSLNLSDYASTNGSSAVTPAGRLEITPMVLERPEEFFARDPSPPKQIVWLFNNYDVTRLTDLFQRASLSESQRQILQNTNRWRIMASGIALEPTLEVVRDLEPTARRTVYEALAETPQNMPYRNPFVYRKGGFEEWFSGCDLPQATLTLIQKMTYTRNEMLCFSDSHYFQITLPSPEVRCLARTLSRVPTLLVNLRVQSPSEIPGLLNYWGSPGRNRSLKPLLESMARVPGGAFMNVSYFLPPVPRLLIYTYPDPASKTTPKNPDCFWTGMNFFNDVPDNRFFDSNEIKVTLRRDYTKVPVANTFGDIIMLYESLKNSNEIKALHMCVYIANDIVFTKNGAETMQPWVLMSLKDMMLQYPSEQTIKTYVYRRNAVQ